MALFDWQQEFESLRGKTLGQIREMFPLSGSAHELRLDDVYLGKPALPEDVRGQKRAKLYGRTWATPIYADMTLLDKRTGKKLDIAKKVKLANLPTLTDRASYIVDGGEYQVLHQWRLKPGVYSRIKENGQLESQFNLAKGKGFKVEFDPNSRKFQVKYGNSHISLRPILDAMGVSGEDIEKTWGTAIAEANRHARPEKELAKLHKGMTRQLPASREEAIQGIRQTFAATELRKDTTQITLGKEFDKVNGQALLLASRRLLAISQGKEPPDERDALQFKRLLSYDDYVPLRIKNSEKRIRRKITNQLDGKRKVRDIMSTDIFNVPITSLFTGGTGVAERNNQTNPVDILGGHRKTTIMGWGGIGSFHAVTPGAKLIDPSHLGFIDPIPTPEGEKTGIVNYLPIGAYKKDDQAAIRAYNPRTHRLEELTPETALHKAIAFPDQYVKKGGKLVPISDTIKVSGKDNELLEVPADQVDYVLPSSRALFSVQTNLIPFLQNDQGGRANYATKHISQAIALKNKEVPLVQTHTGSTDPGMTWEKVVGMLVARRAPVSGKIATVGEDFIKVRDAKGKLHEVQLYKNYPLNDGFSTINSDPLVKKGDLVKEGDLIADTSFTKDGTLALGVNLHTAYIPYKAMNFEDGVVISESAAQKLTSVHLYQERLYAERAVTLNKAKFRSEYPNLLSDAQSKMLDDEGIIRVGQKVQPGDVLVAALRKSDPTRESIILKGIHKNLVPNYRDYSLKWEKDVGGVVQEVVKNGREIKVHVSTEEPAQVGDKLSGRHGNKGVISAILADEEMPVTKDGEPMEMLLNPAGVGGRINPGQLLETALAKVAKKNGEPFAVSNFEPDPDRRIVRVKGHWRTVKGKGGTTKEVWVKAHERGYNEMVEAELEKAGLSDLEPLYDPETGEELTAPGNKEGVMVGYQYALKLEHMASKKLSARSQGYGNSYDADSVPKSGGKRGAQSMGELGLYSLLAHGTGPVHNIREMYTIKSDREQEKFWTAYQEGDALPPPRPPFAYHKFTAYLTALGVNLEKKGHELHLLPLSDKEVVKRSNGKLTRPSRVVLAKNLKPEPGGIFDERITGGMMGSHWSHMELEEPMPNPVFEKAIKGLLGLKAAQYAGLIDGSLGVDAQGKLTAGDGAAFMGGFAFKKLLSQIDVDKDLQSAQAAVKTATKSKLDAANKRVKFLRALQKADLTAEEAYLRKMIPVLPPKFRPLGVLESGDLNVDDVNEIYKGLGILAEKLKSFDPALPPEFKSRIRADIYDGMRALAGLAGNDKTDGPKGILDIIAGPQPKSGWFHEKLLKRRQDLTMRAVITPDKSLGLDEVGLPTKAAKTIFRPFMVRHIVRMGYRPLEAQQEVDNNTPLARKALEAVARERPVLLKRDPSLHKFNVMAFNVRLVSGTTIKIHPLITGGYNADFDGDTMSVYVPVTAQSVAEAKTMMPSKNLFNPSSGLAMYQPTLEAQFGLFAVSQWGDDKGQTYASKEELALAAKEKKIAYDEVVTVDGKKTTAGRSIINMMLPKEMQSDTIAHDPKFALDKKGLQAVMARLAAKHPEQFARVLDDFKDIGFDYGYRTGWSVGLDDIRPLTKIREKAVGEAEAVIAAARRKGVKGKALDQVKIAAYSTATDRMSAEAAAHYKANKNRFFMMSQAGIKPSWDQVRQLTMGPILLQNASRETVPIPVLKSYGEGLGVSDYWTAAHGARMGVISKVQQVTEPGALSKKVINTVIDLVVAEADCKTDKGINLEVASTDVLDRYTVSPLKVWGKQLPAGTLVTPEIQSALKEAKVNKVHVRSALRCQSAQGICGKCFGAFKNGQDPAIRTNLGVLAGSAVGERAVQLAMRVFHEGGVKKKKGGILSASNRLTQMLNMPENLPGSATLATASGRVRKISPDPAGGSRIQIGNENHYAPADLDLKVKVGDPVSKGQALTSGPIHPKELLALTNVPTTQNYLTNEMGKIFEGLGLRRRNYEVIVKGVSNLGKVTSGGDNDAYIRGDLVPVSKAAAWNRANPKKAPVEYEPILKGMSTLPHDLRDDWAARMNYSRLKATIIEAASKGLKSDIHGLHPIPGLVYSAEFGKKVPGRVGTY